MERARAMPKLRTLAVRFLDTIAVGREPLVERPIAAGMFRWLHEVSESFELILVCETVPYGDAIGWLNDREEVWRAGLQAAGQETPARMISASMRCRKEPPQECILLDERALPAWGSGVKTDALERFAEDLQEGN